MRIVFLNAFLINLNSQSDEESSVSSSLANHHLFDSQQ